MVSSLGCDALTSCAAARAGLVRPMVLENYRMRSNEDGREEPVIGHPVSLLTSGYEGNARLCRLIQGSLMDLMAQNSKSPWLGRTHRFYLALPNHLSIHSHQDSLKNPTNLPPKNQGYLESLAKTVNQAIEFSNWNGDCSVGHISTNGRIAALETIQVAAADLAAGTVELAIILAVDSLLDEETLTWLHQSGRLKCDGAPSGLQPGEAGAALLLRLESDADKNNLSSIKLRTPVINNNGTEFDSDQPLNGEGLADALSQVGQKHKLQQNRIWIVSDHNGEYDRATEWGHALLRMRALNQAYAEPIFWYPAAWFGDTNVASLLLAACSVSRAFERRYAVMDTAIIATTSNGKERGAFLLTLN